MPPHERLLIFGASARAAAFSALRAGLSPHCVDLFADADLCAVCLATRLTGKYPDTFSAAERDCPPGPWLYTGGLENHPALVSEIASRRPLWGNDGATLRRCRRPAFLRDAALAAGLPAPRLHFNTPGTRHLLKPLHGAGGRGIDFWSGEPVPRTHYLQEYIDGTPAAALYVAAGGSAALLGVTRQLVGEAWLNAKPFAYCGSVGPLSLAPALEQSLRHLGEQVAGGGLRGLFGIDGVLRDGAFWPIELNPRYTASVEVLEYAAGLRALHLHRLAFEAPDECLASASLARASGCVGKAVVFAATERTFPAEGPWSAAPRGQMPDFADLPHPGDRIEAGWPVCTLLQRSDDIETCLAHLRRRAADLLGE